MAPSFFWYDLETSGTNPRWDRIIQFAGLRTDWNLNPVGDEYSTYVHLPDDVLPNPDATLVTGITPDITRTQGISEWQALEQIATHFAVKETCVVGFNSLRFDDEFMRFGFYRMLRDPYAREWQNGNSRWDIIDLVRATGGLRPQGIEWPRTPEGHPMYKLEAMTHANGLEHGQAHDAMSDVRATLALAQLIKRNQPKLFEYYLQCRFKKQVRKLLEPYGARICIHVSGMYPRERYCLAPVISICRHPTNSNSIIVADLGVDIEPLLQMSEDDIRGALFIRGAEIRPGLKEIRVNRSPFVAGIEVLTKADYERLGISQKQVEQRARRLRKPGINQKLKRVYGGLTPEASADVDAALYEGFLQDEDRSRCDSFRQSLLQDKFETLDYQDKRLAPLAARLKARSFTNQLSAEEMSDWQAFVSFKLNAEDVPWLTLPKFFQRLDELSENEEEPLLDILRAYGQTLQDRFPQVID